MTARLPGSVKLTLLGAVLFVLGGSGFFLPVFGIELPTPIAEALALCTLIWPPVFIAAVMARRREWKEDRR